MSELLASMTDRAGALLRRTRETRGLSIEEVSQSLKLSPRQIRAIESDDFEDLGSATFARGFVRNYARHLGLDPGAVLAVLEKQIALPTIELREVEHTNVVIPREGARRPFLWLGALLPILLVALGAVVYYAGGLNLDILRPGPAPAVQSASSPAAGEERSAATPPSETQATAPAEPVPPAPQASVSAGPLSSAHAATISHRLAFDFERDSWVEVKDGDGRVLHSQLNRGGTTQVIEGKPPFALIVGNASTVRLQYDEREVDLRPHTKVEVARLTLQ
jgi:cytoskeleton protein RodZ